MATNVYMEALSPTMEEGRVAKWHKRDGDAVKTGETLAEVETDKAVMDLVARADGVLRQVAVAEGQTVPVGSVVAVIASPGEALGAAPAAAAPATPAGSGKRETGNVATVTAPAPVAVTPLPSAPPTDATRVKASPLARRMAKEAGVDLKLVAGSGPRSGARNHPLLQRRWWPQVVQHRQCPRRGTRQSGKRLALRPR